MPGVPTWIQSLVHESDGHGIQFIMTKRITNSDWNPHQNRLLIPKQSVNEIQLMLSQEEKTLANLNPNVTVNRGGLGIRVFTRNKFRVEELKLQRWNGTGSSVINGRGMNTFRAWSDLNVADIIEMWGFRDGRDGKLCFAIGKV
ncbi:putative B3 domain-containing protein At3g49610 [Carex rostrata]